MYCYCRLNLLLLLLIENQIVNSLRQQCIQNKRIKIIWFRFLNAQSHNSGLGWEILLCLVGTLLYLVTIIHSSYHHKLLINATKTRALAFAYARDNSSTTNVSPKLMVYDHCKSTYNKVTCSWNIFLWQATWNWAQRLASSCLIELLYSHTCLHQCRCVCAVYWIYENCKCKPNMLHRRATIVLLLQYTDRVLRLYSI